MDPVLAPKLAHRAEAAHLDQRHRFRGMEDHGLWIAVGRRDISEPFDVAAEPVIGILHHQRVDLALAHLLADRPPAALELLIRYRGGDAFRRRTHETFLVVRRPKNRAALL